MLKRTLLALFLLLACPSLADAYNFASGSYTGDGTDNRSIVIASTTSPSVTSFQPSVCIVKGDSASTVGVIRISGMPAGKTAQLFGSGFDDDMIQDLNSTGFQVGTNVFVNSNGVAYYYTCLGDDGSSDLAVGT